MVGMGGIYHFAHRLAQHEHQHKHKASRKATWGPRMCEASRSLDYGRAHGRPCEATRGPVEAKRDLAVVRSLTQGNWFFFQFLFFIC